MTHDLGSVTDAAESVDDRATGRLDTLHARAMLIRGVEERLLSLFAEGKLFGTVHTCIGQEWTGIAVAETLIDGDVVFTNHRGHGHFLARTEDVGGLIAEVMGKQSGVCGGRGGSQHLCAGGVFSNGIQGGIVPVSAGIALAQQLRETGRIAVVFVGDGTLGEGALYEALNIASKWRLPLLVVLENNRYAQSTPQSQTLAGEIEARAAAFGIIAERADTWEPDALLAAAARCVAAVRRGDGPRFLQIDTDRLMAHSKGDDDREPAEVQAYRERDPLVTFAREHPEQAEVFEAEARRRIDAAVNQAEAAPYAEAPSAVAAPPPGPLRWRPTRIAVPERLVNLIHDALGRNMEPRRPDRSDRRGYRRTLRGCLQGHQEPEPQVPRAGPQHPDQRGGDRRSRQRPGSLRLHSGLRDHVRRLPDSGRRPVDQPRREVPSHVQRPG